MFLGVFSMYFIFYIHFQLVLINVDKDIIHTVRQQSNITSLELWIIFSIIIFPCMFGLNKKARRSSRISVMIFKFRSLE